MLEALAPPADPNKQRRARFQTVRKIEKANTTSNKRIAATMFYGAFRSGTRYEGFARAQAGGACRHRLIKGSEVQEARCLRVVTTGDQALPPPAKLQDLLLALSPRTDHDLRALRWGAPQANAVQPALRVGRGSHNGLQAAGRALAIRPRGPAGACQASAPPGRWSLALGQSHRC